MNLDSNPTIGQLREMVKQCDDSAGHHVLWINKSGDVEITCIPMDQTPAGFMDDHPDLQLRMGTFLAGNEYVGLDAAADEEWINELFDGLKKEWKKAKGKADIEHVDMF